MITYHYTRNSHRYAKGIRYEQLEGKVPNCTESDRYTACGRWRRLRSRRHAVCTSFAFADVDGLLAKEPKWWSTTVDCILFLAACWLMFERESLKTCVVFISPVNEKSLRSRLARSIASASVCLWRTSLGVHPIQRLRCVGVAWKSALPGGEDQSLQSLVCQLSS